MPTVDEFLAGKPLRFRVLGTKDEFAVATYRRSGVPYLRITRERGPGMSPIMPEDEARNFHANILAMP